MDFLDELQQRIVPGDGAMGTQLMALGVPGDACFEQLNATDPDRVCAVHESYLAAGARVIRTNSFGGNSIRLARTGHETHVGEFNWLAAQIAGTAAKAAGARIAASVGPLGLSPAQSATVDRRSIFEEQLGALLDGGARLVMLETFTVLDELLAAAEAKHTLHHCPVIASVVCNRKGRMPDGHALPEVITALRAAEVDLVGINCGGNPDDLRAALQDLEPGAIQTAFPSAGLPVRTDAGNETWPLTPEAFAEGALALAEKGVRFIGGCCGTAPAHIAAFTARLNQISPQP
ncbi:MAG: homocysteine S-methyltransferase family protein [Chthoniobacteraceae bacterium]